MTSTTTRLALLLIAAVTLAAPAWADSVKLGGFWIDGVTIQGVSGDNLIYTNNLDAEVVKPLSELQGLKVTAYPDVAVAQDALDKKNDDAAVRALAQVIAKARDPWLKHWAAFHRVQALDRLNKGVEAAQAYVDLVRQQPSPFFLTAPPLNAVKAATVPQQVDIRKRLDPVAARADKIEGLKQLLDLVKDAQEAAPAAAPTAPAAVVPVPPVTPVAPVAPTTPTAPTTPAPSNGEPAAPAAAPAATPKPSAASVPGLVLPSSLPDNDPVTALLKAGKFAEALAECDRLLAMKELRLAMRLYQKGMAQVKLADAGNDGKLYRDAALTFMRSAIYFPRSEYAGPSLMEAAYAHQKFDQPQVAANLLTKAQLLIDAEAEPALGTRLQSLVAGDVPTP